MNIGIDVDDTIANTSVLIYKEIEKNIDKYKDIENKEEKIRDIMRGIIPDEIKNSMGYNIAESLKKITIKDDASEVINEIKESGNKIYIITSRSCEILQTDAYELTKVWLDNYGIVYDKIVINAGDKLDICKLNNIDVMIDDSIHICTLLSQNNIRSIVFNSPTNTSVDTNLERVNNWIELKNIL